jgi:hypothetical protein
VAHVPSKLWDHFRSHHGIVSSAALRRLKVSKSAREHLIRTGVIDVIHEGVYRLRAWPATFESRCAALCAADPTLVICCCSACHLQGLRHSTSDTIHVLTTRTTVPVKVADADDVIVHRTTSLPKAHIIRRADGIRVTKVARALLDEARHRDALTLESLIEDGINRGKCTAQTLRAMSDEMAGRGRRGTALFNEVLRGRPAWRRPMDSHPELVLHAALRAAGLELGTQPSLTLLDGRTIHPDLGDDGIRFYIEIDDHEWHGGRQRTTRDNGRDRQATLGGAQVVRVGTDEIVSDLAGLVQEVLQLHDARRRQMLGPAAA